MHRPFARAGVTTAAGYYRQACGWPAHTFDAAVWILASHPAEALRMPAPLGTRLLESLRLTHRTGPVYTGPGPEPDQPQWTFLVRPRRIDPDNHTGHLLAAGIEHRWARQPLDLPPTSYPAGQLTWITPPTGPLPEFTTAAAALVAVLHEHPTETSHP